MFVFILPQQDIIFNTMEEGGSQSKKCLGADEAHRNILAMWPKQYLRQGVCSRAYIPQKSQELGPSSNTTINNSSQPRFCQGLNGLMEKATD